MSPTAFPQNSAVSTRIRRAQRNERWTSFRTVLSAGLAILNKPEDRLLKSRFNRILDTIHKQHAAGLSDEDLVLDWIRRGFRDLQRLRDATFFADIDLEHILEALELDRRIRRTSRTSYEVRDISKERSRILASMRNCPGPVTTEELRDMTGMSRRHVQEVLADLKAIKKVVRSRTGYELADRKQERIQAGHDDDCLCRQCLTPGSRTAQLTGS